MFYSDGVGASLRMGDIVQGFVLGAARQVKPTVGPHDYQVSLRSPAFSVVLTPCCSIGDKTLSLAPLLQALPKWFDNQYLSNDLTNINREMETQQSVTEEMWQGFSEEERERRLAKGKAYAFVEWFVYAPHTALGSYTIRRRGQEQQVGHYAVDFRCAYRVECDAVANAKQSPSNAKLLELSPETRSELRNKLAFYFGRPPKEDEVQ